MSIGHCEASPLEGVDRLHQPVPMHRQSEGNVSVRRDRCSVEMEGMCGGGHVWRGMCGADMVEGTCGGDIC